MSDHDAGDGQAADFVPGPTLHWSVGDVSVTRVGDWVAPTPRDMLLPDITDGHLADNAAWLGPYFSESGLLLLSIHTFIVKSDDITIVVDTCLGDDPVRNLPGNPTFPERVGAEVIGGLDAVDMVLCTHLHFDHVGWNTRVIDGDRVPTFPNARYLFSREELDYLAVDDAHGVYDDDVQPLFESGLVDIVPIPHQLTSDVRTFATPGHTPGHVSVLIESAGERAVITGDAVHSPIQFRYPEIAATTFDWDSAMSTETRRELIADHADTDALILGTHFAPPTAGHIRRGRSGIWFDTVTNPAAG